MIVSFFQKLFKLYYYLVSPLLGSRCRFTPSCSEYAHQALEQHGAAKGLLLTAKRIARCHPWGGHGYDPVPTKPDRADKQAPNGKQLPEQRK